MDQLPLMDVAPADVATRPGTAIVASQPAGGLANRRAFRFGDPEPVLDRRDFLLNLECVRAGRWFEPPIAPRALARTYRMSPHHQSAIVYKRNQLLRFFEPTRWLDRRNFGEFVLNFLTMGNAFLERRDNLAGRPLTLVNAPAVHTRRGVEEGVYWWCPLAAQETSFRPGYVFHLWEPDLAQELYGLPEYLSALQSGLLNEAATIFRRRYYLNGSHAGYILYINEEKFADADADELAEAVDQSKGPGNFRNVFLHIPGGKKEGVQVIPVGEAAAKDEFLGIKNTTRDDILAAHRVPPVLIGVVPQVNGGFGKPGEAADVFHAAEIEPLQLRLLEINEWAGVEAVSFKPYASMASSNLNA